jgi:hypothetical protein
MRKRTVSFLSIAAVLALLPSGRSVHGQTSPLQPLNKAETLKPGAKATIAPKSPAPRVSAQSAATAGARAFSFEKNPDPVSAALKDLVTTEVAFSKTPDAQRLKIENARQVLNKNRARTGQLLIAELKKLQPDDVQGHVLLLTILQKNAPDKSVITYLTKLALSKDLPSYHPSRTSSPGKQNEKVTTPDRAVTGDAAPQEAIMRDVKIQGASPATTTLKRPCGEENPREMIRLGALSTLYAYAKKGDKNALGSILKTLKSPSVGVKSSAVTFYYHLRKNRSYAKSELRKQLGKDDYYLLNRY